MKNTPSARDLQAAALACRMRAIVERERYERIARELLAEAERMEAAALER